MIINDELTQAFNAKPRIDINRLKTMTPAQLDRVKTYGSAAENLLANKDFALFVHHYKFELMEIMTNVKGHTSEDDARRIASVHQMSGIDSFIASLQKAVYYKNKAVSLQESQLEDPVE